ncbi:hypothetical protein V8D89_002382 [Ganoderma adspersum]
MFIIPHPLRGRHGHLPVQEQISCVLEDSLEDCPRYRHKEHAPLVPRHKADKGGKALPQSIPYTKPLPCIARTQAPTPALSTPILPPIPLECCISAIPLPGFTRINTQDDNLTIAESKVHTVLKHLQAIFDHKALLLEVPHDHHLAIQRISDQLKWISDNISTQGSGWTRSQQQNIEWFCKEFGKVKFAGLGHNFFRITNTIVKLDKFGYLDWVVLSTV